MDIKNFAKNCKRLREEHELTQRLLADFADISQNELCLYENGHRYPSLRSAIRIAQVLRVGVDDLLKD